MYGSKEWPTNEEVLKCAHTKRSLNKTSERDKQDSLGQVLRKGQLELNLEKIEGTKDKAEGEKPSLAEYKTEGRKHQMSCWTVWERGHLIANAIQ